MRVNQASALLLHLVTIFQSTFHMMLLPERFLQLLELYANPKQLQSLKRNLPSVPDQAFDTSTPT